MEYLLCGEAVDGKNLEGAVKRLLAVREVANVTYLLTNREKMISAEALAVAIGGFTGNPAIIKAVQIAIIGVWALIESILDIRTLLDGEKIPFYKTDSYWTTDITNLSRVFEGRSKAIACEEGMSYEGFLQQQIFFMNNSRLAYRMLDMIEHRLQQDEAYQNVRMEHFIIQLKQGMSYAAKPLFFAFDTLSSNQLQQLYFDEEHYFSYFP